MTRDNESTRSLGPVPQLGRGPAAWEPGMELVPTVSLMPAEIVDLHAADIARRLGLHEMAGWIEERETEALMEGGAWEFER